MTIPNITIEQLLEAGVHLGHKTLRWNPKMKKYIFGKRDSIHIIDLTQTLELTKVALEKVYNTIANKDKIIDSVSSVISDKKIYKKMSLAHNPYGDGSACEKIVRQLKKIMNEK